MASISVDLLVVVEQERYINTSQLKEVAEAWKMSVGRSGRGICTHLPVVYIARLELCLLVVLCYNLPVSATR